MCCECCDIPTALVELHLMVCSTDVDLAERCAPWTANSTSSMVGIGCRSRRMARLAHLMSTQRRTSVGLWGLGTTTTLDTHGVGPLVSSMMSSCSSFFISVSISGRKWNEIFCISEQLVRCQGRYATSASFHSIYQYCRKRASGTCVLEHL